MSLDVKESRIQFGLIAPTFTPLNLTNSRGHTVANAIIGRVLSTQTLKYPTFKAQLSYTLITVYSSLCQIHDYGTFKATYPQLQYRMNDNMFWTNLQPGI